ncbi:MAG: hypothetical protein AAGC55_33560, partial [Myxococcota bacterium]
DALAYRVSGERTHIPVAQRLGRYIIHSQRADGSFLHQRNHPSGSPRDFISQYYPGEALLALTALHSADGDAAWLDVAEAGARYLIRVRDRGIATADLVHDHWLLYALDRLYRQRPDPLYLDHAMRIAQAIIGKQRTEADYPDHVGSYSTSPRSTPVATRNEGLLAAHALARDFGRPDMAAAILKAVILGTGVQLATLIDPARAMHLPDPQRALGGFTRSFVNYEVRIDYVQHNLSALLVLADLLDAAAE